MKTTTKKHYCVTCPKRECCCRRANKLIEWVLNQSHLELNGALGKYDAIRVVISDFNHEYLME